MRRYISLLLLLAIACASNQGSGRPKTIAKPDVQVGLNHEPFFGSLSEAPASIDVLVRNRSTEPIILSRVELSSPGMIQYAIYPIARNFRETVAPGDTKLVTVFATAVTRVRRPTEPLTIRAVVFFEGGGSRWREVIMTR